MIYLKQKMSQVISFKVEEILRYLPFMIECMAQNGDVKNQRKIFKALSGPNINTVLGKSLNPFEYLSLKMVQEVLNLGFDPNTQDFYGYTALMRASRYSNTDSSLETVQVLLKAGADPNLQNSDRCTALIYASRFSNTDSSLETVQVLLKAGADPNLQDSDGWTAIIYASMYSNTDSSLETVQVLLKAGADPNLQKENGWTALMIASRDSNTTSSLETVQALLKAGARLDIQNDSLCTGFMYIARYCPYETIISVCNQNLLNITDKYNRKAINYVIEYCGDSEKTKYLLSQGEYPCLNPDQNDETPEYKLEECSELLKWDTTPRSLKFCIQNISPSTNNTMLSHRNSYNKEIKTPF